MMKVCSVDEMRALNLRLTSELGLSELVVMENAGLATCEVLRQEALLAGRFVILCGMGNNGGCGLVVARNLHSQGARARVFVFGDPNAYSGPAKVNFDAAQRCGVPWQRYDDHHQLRKALHGCTAIVDALLGPGLDRNVSGELAEAIEVANQSPCPVISLDLPTGVCANTGQVLGTAVRARATVAFGLPKRGNVLPPGKSCGGRLYVTNLSMSPQLQQTEAVSVQLAKPAKLPPRAPHGHKGTFGDTLIVAGAASYYGAPALAAMACLRAGGGYARLACPQSMVATIAGQSPEVVFVPQHETDGGSIARDNLIDLLELAKNVDFVIIGPGLSVHNATQDLVRDLVAGIDRPLLIDGDGLTAITKEPAIVHDRSAPTVLTPHPGEMARLLGTSTQQVVSDPIAAALSGAEKLNAVVVLKGAGSVVTRPDGHVSVNTTGNDGMGTAGSGDVLTGTISAMYGLGAEFHDAVVTGVFVHGLAGDLAKEEMGADGMTARDILRKLPAAVARFRENELFHAGTYGVIQV